MAGLSSKLLLIVGAALLPALGSQIYSESQARAVRQQLTEDAGLRLLHLARAEQRRIVEGAEQVLSVIANAPSVRNHEPEHCQPLLANLLKEQIRYLYADAMTLDGTPFCASGLTDQTLNPSDRPWFKRALQTGGFVVGDYAIGRVSGQPSIHMARPFRDNDGNVAGVVEVALGLEWLNGQFAKLDLPPGSIVTIGDENGVILARHPGGMTLVGRSQPPDRALLMHGNTIQSFHGLSALDTGRPRFVMASPPGADRSGLMVAVSLDEETGLAAMMQANRLGLALIIAGAFVALALTAVIGRRLIRSPVAALIDAADQWRAGALDARTTLRHSRDEFGRLANAFDHMAETLEARENALRESEERLRLALGAARMGVRDVNLITNVGTWDLEACKVLGLEQGGRLTVGEWLDRVHSDDRARVRAHFENAITAPGNTYGVEYRFRHPDGNWHWVAASGRTIFDAERPVRQIAVVQDIDERKRVEAALRESDVLFRAAFEQAAVGMIVINANHTVLQVNDKLCEIAGYQSEEMVGRDSGDLSHPDHRDIGRRRKNELLAGERDSIVITKRWLRKDGSVIWVNLVGSRLQSIDDRPNRMFAVIEDVTERKRTETELQLGEERLRVSMEAARLRVREFDLVTNQRTWPPAVGGVSGSEQPVAALYDAWLARVHPDDRDQVQTEWQRALADPDHYYEAEYRYRQPDDRWRWTASYGRALFDDGRPVRSIVVLRDISRRKRIEDTLRDNETRLRMSQEAGGIGSWDWDLVTNTGHWSALQCHRFGVDPALCDNVPFEAWSRAVHPDDLARILETRAANLAKGGETEIEYRIVVSGRVLWINSRSTTHFNAVGKPIRRIGIDMDITERRALEDELRSLNADLETRVREEVASREAAQARAAHAERLQALGQLAGGIAHDINNVLQAVAGSLALIQRRSGDAAALKRYAQLGTEAIERGASVTGRLLAFGRRSDLCAEAVELVPLLNGVGELLIHTLGADIDVRVALPGHLPRAVADKGQLETVLVNLATNARDAMPNGGRLLISAETDIVADGDPPHPAGLRPGAYVRLAVADTGTGMDAATLARAREPFFTTKQSGAGTGLGLSMALGFAEQSGGALTIDSTRGQGTTVTLWLPRAVAEPVTRDQLKLPAGVGREPARILVVDDEDTIREVFAERLADAGYAVLIASNGAEALALLAAGEVVDLVLTDLSMPGMNGLTLIRTVQDRYPTMPALLLTGYAEDSGHLFSGDTVSGLVGLLHKPVNDVQLLDRIEAMLTRPTAGRPMG